MKVGVIGAGAISDIYLKNMTEKFAGLEVVAISANHLENAKKKADQYSEYGIKACTTEELLADPAIDMVVVLTPVGSHYGLIKAALNAGKHVYTEKTITDDPARARELIALADEKGLGLASAPDTFFGTLLQSARAAIDEGMLGDINSFAISTTRCNDLLLSVFSFLREPGCGILYDYAVYYMTALVSILGPVDRAGGIVGRPYPQHKNVIPGMPLFGQMMDTPNESQVSAVIKLENGITGTMHIDADSSMADEAYFRIYGTKGILELGNPNEFGGEVTFYPNALDPRKPAEPVKLWNFTPYNENSRGVGPADLAEAVSEGRPIRASKEMAAHVLDVLAAILDGGEDGGFTRIESTCDRPLPLANKSVGAKNIGHASFNMKNTEEMLHFYRDILGMKEQFTLYFSDLAGMINIPEDIDPENLPEGYDIDTIETYRQRKAALEQMTDVKWLTYLKLSDGQFIELFYPTNPQVNREIPDRKANYGYTKLNYEVDDIKALYEDLTLLGIESPDGLHQTVDGSTEFTVHDPDGNEVQFTEYARGENARIKKTDDPDHKACSKVSYTTQVAYQVRDAVNMRNFYTKGLGFKQVDRLTYGDLAAAIEASGQADPQMLMGMKMMADQPWIDYIEVAPHQYIELFYTPGQELGVDRDLSDAYGYQHICIEVEDIHKAWDAAMYNGLTADTQIQLGCDGAYQFWLVDPDGNRLELMEYTDKAMQLL